MSFRMFSMPPIVLGEGELANARIESALVYLKSTDNHVTFRDLPTEGSRIPQNFTRQMYFFLMGTCFLPLLS